MQSLRYDDFEVGLVLRGRSSVTETHLVMSAGLFNDFNPMHADEEFARGSLFGQRILHAPTTIGMMLGVLGNSIAGTGIGDLETTFKFRHPVVIGDTLTHEWTVVARDDKPKYNGGIITFEGRSLNAEGIAVVEALNKILITNTVPAELAAIAGA
jgi:3-hydroxybutyryl-CoA dehydratase